MFGMMEAMLSFLRRQVGLRTDVASASGSLHAKVKEARDTIYNYLVSTINYKITPWHSKQPRFAVYGTSYEGTYTVLDISGSGFITGISCCTGTSRPSFAIKITIDGVVRFDSEISGDPDYRNFISGENEHASISMLHRFNSSLKVEMSGGRGMTFVSYVLD